MQVKAFIEWLIKLFTPKEPGKVIPMPLPPIENVSPVKLDPPDKTPWITIAKRELGVVEIEGPKSNKRIEEYLKTVGLNEKDDTPWCAAFTAWCLSKAGYEIKPATAMARSFIKVGYPMDKPEYGCIVVFWRNHPSIASGHVGFYLAETDKDVLVLGGNQNNQVCEKYYPKSQILAYRWPKGKIQ
jgi:uncharacterized protein (TIGR02594 family)